MNLLRDFKAQVLQKRRRSSGGGSSSQQKLSVVFDPSAASGLLRHFQTGVREVHLENEKNAALAAALAEQIRRQNLRHEASVQGVTVAVEASERIAAMIVDVTTLTGDVEQLHTLISDCEAELRQWQEDLEIAEFEEEKRLLRLEAELEEEAAALQLSQVEVRMTAQLTAAQQKATRRAEERRLEYQRAFQEDMDRYKISGSLVVDSVLSAQGNSGMLGSLPQLEDMSLQPDPEDVDELNEFLED